MAWLEDTSDTICEMEDRRKQERENISQICESKCKPFKSVKCRRFKR